jgi:hypothetical protein
MWACMYVGTDAPAKFNKFWPSQDYVRFTPHSLRWDVGPRLSAQEDILTLDKGLDLTHGGLEVMSTESITRIEESGEKRRITESDVVCLRWQEERCAQ